MNRITKEDRARVLAALVEGCSIRSTVRLTGISKPTILKLLADVGRVCAEYQDKALRNLKCRRIQADEIWSFVYAKQRNVASAKAAPPTAGDVWTWTALDADSKLAVSWMVGPRDFGTATEFMQDVASRLAHKVQLTTDGFGAYLNAVEDGFGIDVDFAQLQKIYGSERTDSSRYSPGRYIAARKVVVQGEPDPRHVSTSYVERQNLTMRMQMRRFTRLTNGFSKKVENHAAMVALHFMHYNFCRIHQSLRITPAMAAGVTEHAWEIEEIVALLEEREPSAAMVSRLTASR